MRNLFRRCLHLIERGTRGRWLLLVALAVLTGFVEALSAVLVLSLLRFVAGDGTLELPVVGDLREQFPGTDMDRLVSVLATIVAVVFLVRGALYLLQVYAQNRIAFRAAARLSARLVRGYFATPWSVYLTRNGPEMTRNAHESSIHFAVSVLVPAISLASEALMLLAILAILIATAPVLTIVTAVVLGAVVLTILRVLTPRLSKFGRLSQDLATSSLRSLGQMLQGMRDIRLLGRSDVFQERFTADRLGIAEANYRRATLSDVPRVALETIVILALVVYLGLSPAVSASSNTVPTLGLFAYGVMRALPSVNRILNGVNALRYSGALIDDLYTDTVAADEAVERRAQRSAGRPPVRFEHSIALDHVSVRYPGAAVDAIRDVSISIRRGETIGVVGPTASGKSTMIDVLTGLLEPTSGHVLVDGQSISADDPTWLDQIGVVPQTPFLIDDTLRRNIALGARDEDVDEALLAEAVELAQLTPVIERLSLGLATVIGERGAMLSGGERQRVSIARVLYRKPALLVLDEGTSALDNVTESELIRALDSVRGTRTTIAVAHRLTTVRECDRLVLLVHGRVVDEGGFDDLVERSALFREMASGT